MPRRIGKPTPSLNPSLPYLCPKPASPCPALHLHPPPQFIIATIPTVLGVNESGRLARALRKEAIPCRRIVVNQLIGPGMGAK